MTKSRFDSTLLLAEIAWGEEPVVAAATKTAKANRWQRRKGYKLSGGAR